MQDPGMYSLLLQLLLKERQSSFNLQNKQTEETCSVTGTTPSTVSPKHMYKHKNNNEPSSSIIFCNKTSSVGRDACVQLRVSSFITQRENIPTMHISLNETYHRYTIPEQNS
jgi:hypothetical protein